MTMHRRVLASLPFLLWAAPAFAQVPQSATQPTTQPAIDDEFVFLPVEPPPLVLDLPKYPEYVPYVVAEQPRLDKQVRAMLEAAMKTDDSAAVAAVVKFALQTQSYDKDEIRDMQRTYNDRRAKEIAAKTEAEQNRIRASGVLQLWKGQIELGGFRSTGNTDNFGFTGSVKLDRKGLKWEHIITATASYQEDKGSVTTSQYLASYQPRYQLNDNLFTYGRAQYERDRIQGYADRYTLSSGLGYKVINRPNKMTLALEFGPAVRYTDYVDDAASTDASAATTLDFDWTINPTIKLTQDATSYIGSDNNTFTSLTAIEAGMAKGLKVKLSYSIEHETKPPSGSLKTDTISRFSLVYGF
jgi:putative salt-induced outer membrane protein